MDLGKWVLSDYYCNKAGQNKKKPGSEKCKDN